jgi:hypothetical protein
MKNKKENEWQGKFLHLYIFIVFLPDGIRHKIFIAG